MGTARDAGTRAQRGKQEQQWKYAQTGTGRGKPGSCCLRPQGDGRYAPMISSGPSVQGGTLEIPGR